MHYPDLRSDLMLGAPDKSRSSFKKVGFSIEVSLLQKLDQYAQRKFAGNRSAAANYLLGARLILAYMHFRLFLFFRGMPF